MRFSKIFSFYFLVQLADYLIGNEFHFYLFRLAINCVLYKYIDYQTQSIQLLVNYSDDNSTRRLHSKFKPVLQVCNLH